MNAELLSHIHEIILALIALAAAVDSLLGRRKRKLEGRERELEREEYQRQLQANAEGPAVHPAEAQAKAATQVEVAKTVAKKRAATERREKGPL